MKALALMIFAATVLGCGSGNKKKATDGETEKNTAAKPEQVEFQTIGQGNLYGSGKEGISQQKTVIVDSDSWTRLMEKMNSVNNVTSGFSETDIDFTKYSVIAVFDKVQNSGGNSIEVVKITESENQIKVFVETTSPDGMATSVMTQPFHIVKIPATDKEVVFE